MSSRFILDNLGEPRPVSFEEYVAKMSDPYNTKERHRIGKTDIGETTVSTVFLSINHNFGKGRPILWETLVFGGPLDGECYRYETRLQAGQGHEKMVQRVRDAQR